MHTLCNERRDERDRELKNIVYWDWYWCLLLHNDDGAVARVNVNAVAIVIVPVFIIVISRNRQYDRLQQPLTTSPI